MMAEKQSEETVPIIDLNTEIDAFIKFIDARKIALEDLLFILQMLQTLYSHAGLGMYQAYKVQEALKARGITQEQLDQLAAGKLTMDEHGNLKPIGRKPMENIGIG